MGLLLAGCTYRGDIDNPPSAEVRRGSATSTEPTSRTACVEGAPRQLFRLVYNAAATRNAQVRSYGNHGRWRRRGLSDGPREGGARTPSMFRSTTCWQPWRWQRFARPGWRRRSSSNSARCWSRAGSSLARARGAAPVLRRFLLGRQRPAGTEHSAIMPWAFSSDGFAQCTLCRFPCSSTIKRDWR